MLKGKFVVSGCFGAILGVLAGPALAGGGGGGNGGNCNFFQGWSTLKSDLEGAVGVNGNGGLGNNMWATIVDNSGIVCAVAFSGADFTSQWLGSRLISAQKANTGNSFSLGLNAGGTVIALSSANLFSAVQPGGSLYGLQASNPVETDVAYGNQPGVGAIDPPPANANTFGTPQDPMVGQRIGGINVFGGGLALYHQGKRVGGLGVSGDTSCTDHMVSWRTRHRLGLDQFDGVGGVAGSGFPDNIIFDIVANPSGDGGTGVAPGNPGGVGHSPSGFGHPQCLNPPTLSTLPAVQ
jgi:hypothetical protein